LAIAVPLPAGFGRAGDEHVLAAREAYRNGERVRLDKQLEILKHQIGQKNELEPWVRYWQLRQRMEDGGVESEGVRAEVGDFLAGQADSYLAEKLRGEWLNALAKKSQWKNFSAAIRCWRSRIRSSPAMNCKAGWPDSRIRRRWTRRARSGLARSICRNPACL